jgi:hypothetical protein
LPPSDPAIDRAYVSRALNVTSCVVVALYSVAAWRSKGIWHFDEFFQILEPLNFKLGRVGESSLPWEFRAHIRPWLQPLIYWGRALSVPRSPRAGGSSAG